jgi:hypothetical protein
MEGIDSYTNFSYCITTTIEEREKGMPTKQFLKSVYNQPTYTKI